MATVLIADDDALIRMVLRVAIEQRGHDVLEAENSDELLTRLRGSEIDLCIMDAAMPGSSLGYRLEALRSGDRRVPVVVMSGYSRPPEVVTEQGVQFLGKPLELAALDELLRERLTGAPGARE